MSSAFQRIFRCPADGKPDGNFEAARANATAQLWLEERMGAALGKRPVIDTLASELAEAVAAGITDGSNPNAFFTRVQAAVMVKWVGTVKWRLRPRYYHACKIGKSRNP